jgi:hypothetical protein
VAAARQPDALDEPGGRPGDVEEVDLALVVEPDLPLVRGQADAVAQPLLALQAGHPGPLEDLARPQVADLEADAGPAGVQGAAGAGGVDGEGVDAAPDRADLDDGLVGGGIDDGEEVVGLGGAIQACAVQADGGVVAAAAPVWPEPPQLPAARPVQDLPLGAARPGAAGDEELLAVGGAAEAVAAVLARVGPLPEDLVGLQVQAQDLLDPVAASGSVISVSPPVRFSSPARLTPAPCRRHQPSHGADVRLPNVGAEDPQDVRLLAVLRRLSTVLLACLPAIGLGQRQPPRLWMKTVATTCPPQSIQYSRQPGAPCRRGNRRASPSARHFRRQWENIRSQTTGSQNEPWSIQ